MNITIPGSFKEKISQFKWQLTALSILLLVVVFLWVLPLIISHQFQKWVLANGGEEVSVENVDFNIFTAKFKIENVIIKRSGYEPLLLPVLELEGKLRDLFDRRFVIENISLEGVNLTIDQTNADSEHIGGILLDKLSSEENSETEQSEVNGNEKPWSFNVRELKLSDCNLYFKHPELESHLSITELRLTDLDNLPNSGLAEINFTGMLDQSPINLDGKMDVFSSQPGFDGKLSVENLNLSPYQSFVTGNKNRKAHLSTESELKIKQLESGDINVLQKGDFSFAKIKLLEENINLSTDQLTWNGEMQIAVGQSPQGQAQQVQAQANGKFNLSGINLKQSDVLSMSAENIDWQGAIDAKLASDTTLNTDLSGLFSIHKIDFNSPGNDIALQNTAFKWQGKLGLVKKGEKLEISSDGNLVNENLVLTKPSVDFKLTNGKIDWQGNTNISFGNNVNNNEANNGFGIKSSSQLKLNDLSMTASGEVERLLVFDEARFNSLDIASIQNVTLESMSFKGLSAGSLPNVKEAPDDLKGFANYDELLFEGFSFNQQQGLSINRIAQSGVNHVLLKNESGEWMFFSLLRTIRKITGNEENIDDATTQTSDSETMAFSIDTFETTDPAYVHYIDKTLPGNFVQKVKVDNFKVTQINSTSDQASQLNLIAHINDAKVSVEGKIALFDENRDFEFTTEINALSLLPYSYFMEKSLGYEVDSGSLNATGTYKAKDAVLESNTELTLHQLDIRALTEDELKKLDAKQNSGIETGLSMLKDKNDTIELNIPVNGNFDDIKVDPSDIINQALGSALKTGAKTYLAAALFPFGTLLVVADVVGSNAMQVNLDPIFFEAGQTELVSESQDYLKKIAEVLEEKPEIFIKVCGISVKDDETSLIALQKKRFNEKQEKLKQAQQQTGKKQTGKQSGNDAEPNNEKAKAEVPQFKVDQELLNKELNTIAKNRGTKVSRYLIDKLSVEAKRLIPCQPKLDLEEKSAKPRTDLSI